MATRRESVRLELEDHFTTPMARAAAAAALMNAELDRMSRSTTSSRHTQTTQTVVRNTESVTRATDQGASSLNQFTGRLSAMAQVASVLGPALIPIGAVAVPAVTGLANMMAAAGLAGGTLLISLNGIADAVKAVDAYRLDPTAASLEKARDALKDMSPEARNFVGAFQDFQPVLAGLRDAAQEGWMPGLTESLDNLERVAPHVERLITALSETGGGLVADVTDSLASDRWTEFLDFLATEMPSTLLDVTDVVGSLTHGMTELWMAFDPLNDDFSSWMVDSAADFDTWAEGLAQTEGFQEFMDYVRENGPQVEKTLNAFAMAAVDFATAAAPLGGPILEALELFAQTISAIANSPMGPKLFTMAAAFVVLNKTLAVTAGLMSRLGFVGPAAALRGAAPGAGGAAGAGAAGTTGAPPIVARIQAARTSLSQLRADLGTMRTDRGIIRATAATAGAPSEREQQRAAAATQRLTAAQQRQTAAVGQLSRGLAVGAAGTVAFAVASGKMGEGMGLSNTAMLALVGSMTGPYGAAVGAGIGLMLDFRDHTNEVQDAQANLNQVMDSSTATYAQMADAQQKVSEASAAYRKNFEDVGSATSYFASDPLEFYKLGADALDGNFERLAEYSGLTKATATDVNELARTFLQASQRLGDTTPITAGDLVNPDVERIQGIIDKVAPSMQRLGVTLSDLQNMSPEQRNTFLDDLVADTLNADTASGRIATLTEVITNSGEIMLTAKDRANALRIALDDLLSPQMGLTATSDAWTTSLRTLNDDLAKNKTLVGDSDSAIKNRAAIQERITKLTDKLVGQANAGAGRSTLAKTLRDDTKALLDYGEKLGMGRGELRTFLADQGLSGRTIQQIMRRVQVEAKKTRKSVATAYDTLPEEVKTKIATDGVPRTRAQIDALVKKYKLTEKQRQALITLRDLASQGASNIKRIIDSINSKDITITARVVTNNVQGVVADAARRAGRKADGGSVPKDNGTYEDKYPYLLAPGEEIISNRYGQADRFRADRAAGLIPGYADGGTVGRLADGGTTTPRVPGEQNLTVLARAARESARELKRLQSEVKASTKTLEDQRSRRAELSSTIRSNFASDPFAVSEGSVWGKSMTADPLSALRTDNADLRQYESLIKTLRRRGLKGDALGEADTLTEAQTLAGMNLKDLGKYGRLYEQRQYLQKRAAGTYATAVTGVTPADIDRLAREVRQVRNAVVRAEAANDIAQERNSNAIAASQRGTARKAAQRKRKNP